MAIRIISYNDGLKDEFKQLNLVWLERYHLLEPHDVEILNHPKEMIIDAGGAIFFAEDNGAIVGSAAVMKLSEGVFELVKMAVREIWQGKGISKLLLEACLAEARRLKAEKIILFSNSQLKVALALYKKYGFKDVPVDNSPFETADVKMELILH
jgi:putative acetyltransferase